MSEKKDFTKLCKDYDSFLRNKNFFQEKFYFSFLQIKSSKSINFNFNSENILKKSLFRFYPFIKEIFLNLFSFNAKKIISGKSSKILLVSTCVNKKHLKDIDFYLGHIISDLKKKIPITLLLRNLTGEEILRKDLNKKFDNIEVLVFQNKLNIIIEFFFFLKSLNGLFKIFFNLKKKKYFIKFLFPSNLLNYVSNLREIYQFKKILKKNKYKIFMTTYEGNAWERLFFFNTKKIIPDIKNIGYHFNYHLEHEHSIFRNLFNNLDPDSILTSCEYSKNLFKKKNFKCKKMINIGGNRYLNRKNIYKKKPKFNVLIIPEGFISETLLLYNFVSKFLNYNGNYNFTMRLHPSLKNMSKDIFLDKRIKLSSKTLKEDLNLNQFAFYRGSSAIISAVNRGLIPIYYSFKNELSLDPFYELNKNIVYNDDLEKFENILMNKVDKKMFQKLNNFSSRYYSDFGRYKKNLNFVNKIL